MIDRLEFLAPLDDLGMSFDLCRVEVQDLQPVQRCRTGEGDIRLSYARAYSEHTGASREREREMVLTLLKDPR